jgi:hypothetical protein
MDWQSWPQRDQPAERLHGALRHAVTEQVQQNRSLGEAVLAMMRAENAAKLPHYRNVVFGDSTLPLSY